MTPQERWLAKNKDRALAMTVDWQRRNRERRLTHARTYREKYPERVKASQLKARSNGRGAFYGADYRAKRKRATPPWVDPADMKFVYDMAALFGMEVDHIHPLCGKNFCGLNIPLNLQLLTRSENATKSNRLP